MRRVIGVALWLMIQGAQAASVFEHPATAEQLLRDLGPMTATLRDAQTLRGNFSQSKTLTGLPRPLLAEGSYLFARERGIAWRTVKPFESELVITKKEIVQRDAGSTTSRSSADAPAVAGIFFAVFALDFHALEKLFVLHSRRSGAAPSASAGVTKSFSMTSAAEQNATWELGLLPRQGLGDAIQRIVVFGGHQVHRIVLLDQHGDETDIRLRDSAASNEPLSAADENRFK